MRKLAVLAILASVAMTACGASGSSHASQPAGTARTSAASSPAPSPSPSPMSAHDIALNWWNSSAHPALRDLQIPYARFQALGEQGKVDEGVCQQLRKAGDDAASIGGSGIDALDSAWFPMAQHFGFLGSQCQTAATVDLDSAWDSMSDELQLAIKDLVAFKGELAKQLGVSHVDV